MDLLTVLKPSFELTLLGWLFTGLLLFLVLVSVLASRGTIPLNHLIGIRIPAVTSSDAAWRAGHRSAVIPAIIVFVVALVFSLLGLIAPVAYVVVIVAFVGGFIRVAIRASVAAARVPQ